MLRQIICHYTNVIWSASLVCILVRTCNSQIIPIFQKMGFLGKMTPKTSSDLILHPYIEFRA